MGGVTFVPLRRSNRETAGVAGGDTIEVTLTLDTAPRTVTPPTDLVAAIHAAGLEAAWAKQSYTRQREAAEAVEGAKKPETRARRIKAARSEEHTSELQSLMRTQYAVFCLKNKTTSSRHIHEIRITDS